MIDFKRRKDDVPAKVARDRVRPEPHRVHRAAPLRRRREALHPRAGTAEVGDDGGVGAGADIVVGNALPLRGSRPARSSTTSSSSRAAAARWAAPPARDPAGRQGRRAATLRLPSGEMRLVRRLPRDRRRDRQRRSSEHRHRQGRPQPSQGHPPADARHRDEPRRPPARWRRGLDHARASPGHPLGRADARLPDAQEEEASPTANRARPRSGKEGR